MKGDFSRMSYHERNHYSLVLMQQGRVQLDADWNEQAMIQWSNLQKLVENLIGEHGGPNDDFLIEPRPNQDSSNTEETIPRDFIIRSGRYYVGGIMCENDEDCAFTNQKDYPIPEGEGIKQGNTNYLVYLHVWFRHITNVQDDSIREVALNGADTATRIKTVWQVKVIPLSDTIFEEVVPKKSVEQPIRTETLDLSDWQSAEKRYLPIKTNYRIFETLLEKLKNDVKKSTGLLKAQAMMVDKTDKPCLISPQNRYRGAENQLYRVEIHKSGGYGEATFKWSRENGSVVFPILSVSKAMVTLEHLGRDARCGLKEGDWVEFVDDDYELQGKTQDLLQVISVDPVNMKVTLSGTSEFERNSSKHPFLRRWDHQGDEKCGGALKVEAGKDLELEDGIQIQFVQEKGKVWFRSGDWWWIPARTATGDVEWPRDGNEPLAQEPLDHGHRYAPLALINVNADGKVDESVDLRRRFKQLWK
ncbi:MAG: hypothetical protein HC877_13030 [Thioploca sp.]|nr:hypothetical protein [Thioploca sp.]